MTENVENAIFEVLKKIQTDISSFRAEVNERFAQVDERFERVEDITRNQRRDVAGVLVTDKSVAGTFAEDLAVVNARVAALEARQS